MKSLRASYVKYVWTTNYYPQVEHWHSISEDAEAEKLKRHWIYCSGYPLLDFGNAICQSGLISAQSTKDPSDPLAQVGRSGKM